MIETLLMKEIHGEAKALYIILCDYYGETKQVKEVGLENGLITVSEFEGDKFCPDHDHISNVRLIHCESIDEMEAILKGYAIDTKN